MNEPAPTGLIPSRATRQSRRRRMSPALVTPDGESPAGNAAHSNNRKQTASATERRPKQRTSGRNPGNGDQEKRLTGNPKGRATGPGVTNAGSWATKAGPGITTAGAGVTNAGSRATTDGPGVTRDAGGPQARLNRSRKTYPKPHPINPYTHTTHIPIGYGLYGTALARSAVPYNGPGTDKSRPGRRTPYHQPPSIPCLLPRIPEFPTNPPNQGKTIDVGEPFRSKLEPAYSPGAAERKGDRP